MEDSERKSAVVIEFEGQAREFVSSTPRCPRSGCGPTVRSGRIARVAQVALALYLLPVLLILVLLTCVGLSLAALVSALDFAFRRLLTQPQASTRSAMCD